MTVHYCDSCHGLIEGYDGKQDNYFYHVNITAVSKWAHDTIQTNEAVKGEFCKDCYIKAILAFRKELGIGYKSKTNVG